MLKLSQTLFGFATRSFSMKANPVVAVVLSGCGVYDGSEVHEVSAVFVNLSRNDVAYNCFAPNTDQMHVINHTNGEVMSEKRNVMVESARISRGEITPLDKLSVEKFDAVIFPGGFGAAKNLSDFAVKNVDCTLNKNVEAVIKSFHSSNKPIGLCCISPVLAAKAIAGSEVTVGMDSTDDPKWPYAGTAGAINSMGGKHFNKNVQEVHVDKGNKIVTTPAYMCDTKVHEVHDGIAEMVKQLLKLI